MKSASKFLLASALLGALMPSSAEPERPNKGVFLKLPLSKKQKKARAASKRARKARKTTRKHA